MVRARGANRGRRPNVATKAQLNTLRREMQGHKLVPSDNPPVYVERPWNAFTFQRTEFTTAGFETVTIRVSDIINQIRSRLNINSVGSDGVGNNISLKIEEARVWCTAASLILPDLECSFYELRPGGSQSVRYTQRDIGTLNMPAKVGYSYPTMDSKEILDVSDATTLVLSATASAQGSQVTPRVQVLWKSST